MTTVAEHHARADTFIAKSIAGPRAPKPCCSKGCFACCSEALYVSNAEADYIVAGLTDEQKKELEPRILAWLEKAAPLLSEKMPHFLKWRSLNLPCPLLKDGLCSVYERRPFGCRAFLALGDPKDCEMPARSHQKFARWRMERMYAYIGLPPTVNGILIHDHLGVLLAERLLGLKPESGSRETVLIQQDGNSAIICKIES